MPGSNPIDDGAETPNPSMPTPSALPLPMSQAVLEALPFPLSIYTCDGLYVGANELVEQFFRVPKDALVGRFNLLSDPVSQQSGARDLFLAAVAGQRLNAPRIYYDFSFPGTRTHTEAGCWVDSTFLPFHDAAGCVTHVGMLFQDVSERVSLEREATMFKTLVEHASDGIGITNMEGRLTYCNPAYQTLTGYGAATIGMTVAEIHPDEIERISGGVRGIESQGHWHGQIQTRRADGSYFPADVSAFLLWDHTGKPSGSGAILRDISERKQYEEELRTFKALVENTPDSVAIADLRGMYRYVNPAYRAMLRTDQDLVGKSVLSFIVEEDLQAAGSVLSNLQDERICFVEARYRRADGSIVPTISTIFLQENPEGGQQLIAFVRDISEQQRAEEERAAFQQQVIAAQQAALRELSTPLIPIADGVVVMPLIGSIDSSRAQQVIEALLNGVAELRAQTTIIDITGVPIVDTQIANALIRAAQAVKLLGAQAILTGIRPEVAQTLVGLGVDLGGIITRSTLQSGIAEALSQLRGVVRSG